MGNYANEEQLIQIANKIKADYAKKDGYYPLLHNGLTDQLDSKTKILDQAPYNLRPSAISIRNTHNISDFMNDKLVGGTIAWNQLVQNGNFESTSGWSVETGVTASASNYAITLTATAEINRFRIFNNSYANIVSGHKYYVTATAKSSIDGFLYAYVGDKRAAKSVVADTWVTVNEILMATTGSYWQIDMTGSIVAGTTAVFRNYMCFDLTAMFGSTIADYIYSLEQATAGAGVAWFKKLFPKPYYEYNAGGLMSVCTNEHKMVGFNAWDENAAILGEKINSNGETISSSSAKRSPFIRCVPNAEYYFSNVYTSYQTTAGGWYDINKNFIRSLSIGGSGTTGSAKVTSPANAAYMIVCTPKAQQNVCVNLSWSGYRNGEYEPYVEHNYPLSPVELRGIPKLDSANNLYYDGDTYEKDGTVTRKYGIVDLGTLNWSYSSNIFRTRDLGNVKSKVPYAGICSKYESTVTQYTSMPDKSIKGYDSAYSSTNYILIKDTSYETVEAFTAAMSGVYLVYPLTEQTTETANPFTDPQIVDDFGTEEYVDALATAETSPRDVAIPVGHETLYGINLRDRLQALPDMPSNSGQYVINYDASTRTSSLVSYPTHRYHYIADSMTTVSGISVPTITYDEVTTIMTQMLNNNTVIIDSYDRTVQGTFTGRDKTGSSLVLVLLWGSSTIVTYSITQDDTSTVNVAVKSL